MTNIQVSLGLTNVAAVFVLVGMFVEAGSSMLFEVADVKAVGVDSDGFSWFASQLADDV